MFIFLSISFRFFQVSLNRATFVLALISTSISLHEKFTTKLCSFNFKAWHEKFNSQLAVNEEEKSYHQHLQQFNRS